jgi:hypothetical protein
MGVTNNQSVSLNGLSIKAEISAQGVNGNK